MLITLASVVTNNKHTLKKIPISNKQNNSLILATLKLVRKQFFQCQKDKLPIVVAW